MGRIGITEYQVFQAADQLAAEGLHPSVDAVRAELGNTGSRTTINNYLKLWRERRADRDAAGTNLSGHLKQVITEQSELLLSVLEAESSAKLQAKTQEFNDTIQSLQESYHQLELAYKQSQSVLKLLQETNEQQALQLLHNQSELADLREQHQSQREVLAKENGRRETLERAMNDRDHQLAAVQKELRISHSRNEILGESVATKVSELQQLQQKEREQRTLIKDNNEEIKRLNRELATVRAAKENELERLTRTLANLLGESKQKRTRKALLNKLS